MGLMYCWQFSDFAFLCLYLYAIIKGRATRAYPTAEGDLTGEPFSATHQPTAKTMEISVTGCTDGCR